MKAGHALCQHGSYGGWHMHSVTGAAMLQQMALEIKGFCLLRCPLGALGLTELLGMLNWMVADRTFAYRKHLFMVFCYRFFSNYRIVILTFIFILRTKISRNKANCRRLSETYQSYPLFYDSVRATEPFSKCRSYYIQMSLRMCFLWHAMMPRLLVFLTSLVMNF